ncbi:MAG: aminoacyl-tRNA hydrolase [Planctomycetes bacterium]|nr:aminoacyl-tRNA hydrolase [Planctomycetota bacterium]
MKLFVGLGNPGRKYARTRHNIGFEVLAELARRFGTSKPKSKFQGKIVEAVINNESSLLLCPLTYMNNSGNSVQPARDFYKLPDDELLVICDDFNLPLAKLRFRARGSAGGQKGLHDIIQRLGTDKFARLRIGIGAPPEDWDVADYVLSKFTKQEIPEVEKAVSRAADVAAIWISEGVEHCMNHFNAGVDTKNNTGDKRES